MRIRTRDTHSRNNLCTLLSVTEHGFLSPYRHDRKPYACHVQRVTACLLLAVTLTAIQVKRITAVILFDREGKNSSACADGRTEEFFLSAKGRGR